MWQNSSADILFEEMPVSEVCSMEWGRRIRKVAPVGRIRGKRWGRKVQDCVVSLPRNSRKSAAMLASVASVVSKLVFWLCLRYTDARSTAAMAITRSEEIFAPRYFVL